MMKIFKNLFSRPQEGENDYSKLVRVMGQIQNSLSSLSQQILSNNKAMVELTKAVAEFMSKDTEHKMEDAVRREDNKPTEDDLRY